jgi:hypothetical protein
MREFDVDGLAEDPVRLADWDSEALFDIDYDVLQAFQLKAMRKRLRDMLPKIRVLRRLAEDIEMDGIEKAEDITALCFPHTMYKSYSATYVEQGRFDKMTQWLGGLSAIDLSSIDATSCESLEQWLDLIEEKTIIRPLCSSGTSGKISFYPRTQEELENRLKNFVDIHGKYRDEQASRLGSGEIDFFTPYPLATGRHNLPSMFQSLRDILFKGDASHVHTLGQGHWNVDLLWLSGRIKSAEAKGELAALKLTPAMERMRAELAVQQEQATGEVDRFIETLMIDNKGKEIFLHAGYPVLIPLAQECRKRGLKADFGPGTYVLGGGPPSAKGMANIPEDWAELCQDVFPYTIHRSYGMTESTGAGRRCPHGHYHVPPTNALFLLDPDTSRPLPREDVQTGRYAFFDLLAQHHWGGTITGDRVTIDWNGHCPCGRKGPFIHDEIVRYMNLRDDDKITCAKSPDAYEKAVELTLGMLPA